MRQESRFWGGALPDSRILEKHLTILCVALFNAAHSLFSLNRWKLDPVFFFFLNVYKMSTNTHTTPLLPPHLFLLFALRCLLPGGMPASFTVIFFSFFFFASCLLTARCYIAPPPCIPWDLRGVKCTINAIFINANVFFLIMYRVYFFSLVFLLPICFLIYCIHIDIPHSVAIYLFIVHA